MADAAWTPEADWAKEASVSVKKNFYSDNVSGAAPEIREEQLNSNASYRPT